MFKDGKKCYRDDHYSPVNVFSDSDARIRRVQWKVIYFFLTLRQTTNHTALLNRRRDMKSFVALPCH
jgi:hypothetical protein